MFDRHDRQGELGLTERERAVLALMASGATNPEIAEQLHLSKHTVKEHTSSAVPQAWGAQPHRGRPAQRSAWGCWRDALGADVSDGQRAARSRGSARSPGFLALRPPFEALAPEELGELVADTQLEFHPAAT